MRVNVPQLLNRWATVSRLGTDAGQDYPTRRRIVMVNQSAMLGVMISLAYAIFSIVSVPVYAILLFSPLFIAGYAGVNWLNYRRRYLLARILLLLVPSVQVSLAAWLFGKNAGVQLYFFVLWTSMFLLFSRRDLWLSAVGGVLWISLFLWVALRFEQPRADIAQNADFLQLLLVVDTLGAFALVGVIVSLFFVQINRAERLLQREYRRSEQLLENILPASVATRLKNGSAAVADNFTDVTLLFADIVGFTRLAEALPPDQVVELLNRVFSEFDRLVEHYNLEKIKTIGDEYMLAGGIPIARNGHVQDVAETALQMLAVIQTINREFAEQIGQTLALRVGIHCGEVVAGVIGSRKFSYDVWGDTVNTASRMQSQGLAGRIQVTEAVYEKLNNDFEFKRRGTVRVRGKGRMPTWFLLARKA